MGNIYKAAIGPAVGGAVSATAYRMFLLGPLADPNADSSQGTGPPAAGGAVDGCGAPQGGGIFACPGWPIRVEAGGTFAAGDLLQTDALGRVVLRTTGAVVARALEAAAAAGNVVQAVFAR